MWHTRNSGAHRARTSAVKVLAAPWAFANVSMVGRETLVLSDALRRGMDLHLCATTREHVRAGADVIAMTTGQGTTAVSDLV